MSSKRAMKKMVDICKEDKQQIAFTLSDLFSSTNIGSADTGPPAWSVKTPWVKYFLITFLCTQ